MATRLAINGFGRIGRMFYRALYERNFLDGKVEVVAVNDIVPAQSLAYLLKYDSAQGNMKEEVKAHSEDLVKVGDSQLKTLAMKVTPGELPWRDLGVDIVVESTGLWTKKADAQGHLDAGAGKVIISAPSEEDVKTVVIGANDGTCSMEDTIISNGSCTTNCLVPVIQVLMQEDIGVEEGLMTTIHSYTADQVLIDAPHKKDFRRGRAAALNMVPTSSGAAQAVSMVYPELKGKLTGMAFRVPTPTGSVVDFTFKTQKETSMEEINQAMKKASESYLQGILGYTEEAVVSTDFVHDPRSSIYDATAGIELNSRFFKLVSWYDNEWGYSNRLVDLVSKYVQ